MIDMHAFGLELRTGAGQSHAHGISRRAWLSQVGAAVAAAAAMLLGHPARAWAATTVTVYKDPSCRCCADWVKHLRKEGFAPVARDRSDMDSLKDSLGVPAALRSCHTAVAGRYVIEGHVPASDIKRLLATHPASVTGLAVPGMPVGSPGMEMGGRKDNFDVIAFGPAGRSHVFAKHGG